MLNSTILLAAVLSLVLLGGCATDRSTASAAPKQLSAADDNQGPSIRQASVESVDTTTIQTAPLAAPGGTDPVQDYRIGAQDLLEIEVFGAEELSRKVRVNGRGYIALPLIGQVQATGLTSTELAAKLATELSKEYLQDPQVSVFIAEFTSQRVTVEGAVNKPGIYPIQGQTTLLQAVAVAEGLAPLADPGSIKVFRSHPDGGKQALDFDLNEIRDGASSDPVLRGNDIVVVDKSAGKQVLHTVTSTLRGFIQPFGFGY